MRMTIKLKLSLVFVTIIVLVGAMAMLAIVNLSSLNSAISQMVAEPVADMGNVAKVSDLLNGTVRDEKNAIMNTDPAAIGGFVKSLSSRQEKLLAAMGELDKSADELIRKKAAEFRSLYDEYLPLQKQAIQLATENTTESNARAAAISMGAGRELMTKALAVVEEMVAEASANVKRHRCRDQ